MLRSAITSAASLLVIAFTNPLLTANAEGHGTEFYWCESKGFTTFTDAAGNQSTREKAEIWLLVEGDEMDMIAALTGVSLRPPI